MLHVLFVSGLPAVRKQALLYSSLLSLTLFLPSPPLFYFKSIIDHVSINGYFGNDKSNLAFREMRRSDEKLESVVSGR